MKKTETYVLYFVGILIGISIVFLNNTYAYWIVAFWLIGFGIYMIYLQQRVAPGDLFIRSFNAFEKTLNKIRKTKNGKFYANLVLCFYFVSIGLLGGIALIYLILHFTRIPL
jgi:hypothetical protein